MAKGLAFRRIPAQLSKHVHKSRTMDPGINNDISSLILLLLEYFFQSALVSVISNKIYRLQCYITFHKSQVTFERATLNTKIESLFNIYYGFIFFQGICSECKLTLGEHVRADCQDLQLIALSESIHELSLESTSYFGSIAHTIDFICNYIQHESLNFMKLPYNSDSALPFFNQTP